MDELAAPSRALLRPGASHTSSGAKVMTTASITEIFVAPKNPRACLDGLPEELLMAIVDELPERGLGRLSKTNKRYNRLANTCLYEYLGEYDHKKRYSIAHNPRLAELLLDASVNLEPSDSPEFFRMPEAKLLQFLKNSVNLCTLYISSMRRSNLHPEDCAVEWPSLLNLMRNNVTDTGPNRFSKISYIHICCDTVQLGFREDHVLYQGSGVLVLCALDAPRLSGLYHRNEVPLTAIIVARPGNSDLSRYLPATLNELKFGMEYILDHAECYTAVFDSLKKVLKGGERPWCNITMPRGFAVTQVYLSNTFQALQDAGIGLTIKLMYGSSGPDQVTAGELRALESEEYESSEYSFSDDSSDSYDSDEDYESDDFELEAMLAEHADMDDMDESDTDESDE
ncbi:hypothetical protein FB567DRAFT_549176 [Paraphoma chrysanthemicola]|uniref:F-box domain-containing protein n=1 Tax=Paraphoma chrysanthemicola TaxID=798071 RepID=A0A8K0R793_9PLEO|nr:hypothetical protein FB567DRAFT_549176 [Paraphoma chrysanthemicola]